MMTVPGTTVLVIPPSLSYEERWGVGALGRKGSIGEGGALGKGEHWGGRSIGEGGHWGRGDIGKGEHQLLLFCFYLCYQC